MQVTGQKTIKLTGPSGVEVTVDLSKTDMTEEQSAALDKLLAGDHASLSEDELMSLKTLKALVQGGDNDTMMVATFDLRWVKIND